MLRVLFIAALVLLASRPSEAPAQPAAPPRINCPDPYPVTADLMPAGASPLVLAQIYCLKLRQTYFPTSAPMISPDGQSIAYYEHDTILRVGRLDGRGGWIDYQADLGVFATFEFASGAMAQVTKTIPASCRRRIRARAVPMSAAA